MCAKFIRLFEGHPDRRGITSSDRGRPQHHDIDAAIGYAVGAKWPADPPRRMLCVPGFQPWADALLQFRDNLIGDSLMDISPHFSSPLDMGC
jgi:hypothetical protein